jgi:hypothetical protein
MLPGGSLSGYVPKVQGTDLWKGQLNNRIPAGTVLTAILEDDLSSGKNKQGDTFALTLDDGWSNGAKLLIPPKSKILGSVMSATSAKFQKGGHPGTMEVSLQTLVFPDGSHYPIFAFIDGNPNSKHKSPPKVRNLGQNIADYGQSVAAMATSFVTGPGYMMSKLNRGLEFQMDSGDAVPIRLTRSLDIKPSATASSAGGNPSGLPFPPNTQVPGLVDPTGPIQIPGFVPGYVPQNGYAPQQGYAPPAVPTANANGMPPVAPPIGQQGVDPNAVFNQPVGQHPGSGLHNLPDPF